jgi:hypothetical protein
MTTTNESLDETPVDEEAKPQPVLTDVATDDIDADDVAEAAARDVARLLDRRGLREVVALAHRALRESTWLASNGGPRSEDKEDHRCTLRQHERSTRRGAAGRAVDDDRA